MRSELVKIEYGADTTQSSQSNMRETIDESQMRAQRSMLEVNSRCKTVVADEHTR